ncbi:hypothetical protein IV454_29315 [Massilia antarctica]|uniref:Uncharacterized protein n=1 Tax=Massilia antarctica TaxID=2765360 RepID=A0AA49A7J6_9BURK|nr:hypothetical protein [Massilia antarctica]QPI49488.1 hypothetical protein IV454_29315 [Massilia antarctica]
MSSTINLTEKRLLARVRIALALSRTHRIDHVAGFLLDYGSAIDHACGVLHLVDVTPEAPKMLKSTD